MSPSFVKALFLFILVLSWSTCIIAGPTWEEQLQQLREDNAETKQLLTVKVNRLEEKVAQLETKVQHQETLITELQRQRLADPKPTRDLVETKTKISGKTSILRTCREIRAADPSLSSGMYWIDPDGQGVGDDPINVYCDMNTGSTSVLHDSESQMDVGHCMDPGCYSRPISYSSTKRQMVALAELSNECHQSIRYDCISAPFEISGITYSWWDDRDGNPQYFWSGNNATVHTCQCGLDHNCVEVPLNCNCDSSVPTPLADIGIITDKNFLPITRLNFGRTILEGSSGMHTLGRFECTGQVAVNGMPSSCADLWKIGHSLSGLYSVLGTEMVETIYCDFSELPNEPNFQKWIGYADVKSFPTYFYVQRNSSFSTINVPIPFQVEKLNVGGAMDLSSGVFTAPRAGIYFFDFTGFVDWQAGGGYINVAFYLNGNRFAVSNVDESNTGPGQKHPIPLQCTLNLQAGDRIWVEVIALTSGCVLFDSPAHFNHFTGWLLHENVSQSLN